MSVSCWWKGLLLLRNHPSVRPSSRTNEWKRWKDNQLKKETHTMRNHIITDSPNCPIFRFDTLELTSRAISSLVFSFSSSFYHFSSRQQFFFLTPWRLSFLNAQSATPMFDGWWLQTGKNENGKTKNVLLFFISSEAKTILFFWPYTRE
jgi:hypothetical protein